MQKSEIIIKQQQTVKYVKTSTKYLHYEKELRWVYDKSKQEQMGSMTEKYKKCN